MTGLLYARVAGAWVPIATQANPPISLAPAEAGPRDDAPTQARFGHVSGAGHEGYMVQSDGALLAISGYGDKFSWYQRNAANNGFDWIGDITSQKFQLGDIVLGVHPAIGRNALWLNSQPGGGDYMLAREGAGTFVNAATGYQVEARINNIPKLTVNVGSVHPQVRCYCIFNLGGFDWSNAHFIAQSDSNGHQAGAKVAFHQPGYWAWQLRASSWEGSLAVINSEGGGYGPITASAFPVGSSIDFKRDVRTARTIGLERERIVVRHDPRADLVPDDLDIMALRPVAFRPKEPTLQSVEVDGGHEFRPWPQGTVPQLEGDRERLGLVAEEVETIIPSAVSHGPHGNVVGVDYAQITVALLAHVQRLTEEVATLRYRIAELEGQP